MKLYLFNSAPSEYLTSFKSYCLPQNIKASRLMALIWLCISLTVLGSNLVWPYEQMVEGAAIYRVTYYSYAISSAVALFLLYWLRQQTFQKRDFYLRIVCIAYAYVFAITCLLMSVAYQGNPVNNMTMYLMGLILVGTLWVLELQEVLVLVCVIELTFAVGIQFINLTAEEMLVNQTGSVFLLILFFLLSRLSYSFRANHFVQLVQIEEKNLALQEAVKAKTEILGIVAHDLRAPFANIEMLTAMVRKKNMPPENEEKFYDMIMKSCSNSKSIINDLLEMSRFDQEEEYQLQKTDISSFIEEVHGLWQIQLNETRQFLFSKPNAPVYVNLHPEKFKRVLDNLITNAVKFTKDSGSISIVLSQQDREVLLQISDNGIGIPQTLQPHLFAPFSKASRKGVRGEKSVGLGLSITHELVEQHQGKIEVVSNEQQGTSFHIMLPLCN